MAVSFDNVPLRIITGRGGIKTEMTINNTSDMCKCMILAIDVKNQGKKTKKKEVQQVFKKTKKIDRKRN